jgi:hypothetical protein
LLSKSIPHAWYEKNVTRGDRPGRLSCY